MKKKIWSLATMVVMAVAFGVLNSSCSSDGDGGTLSEPEYSDVSAKYNIGSSSPYSSIELTESGHYVVTLNSAQAKTRASEEEDNTLPTLFVANAQEAFTRGTNYGNVIYGKYTKNEDGSFQLEGFGTVVISQSSGTYYSLNITLDNGTTLNYPATKTVQQEGKTKTIQLCRSWKIRQLNLVATMEGYGTVYNGSVQNGDLPRLMKNMLQHAWELDGNSGSMPEYYINKIDNTYSIVESITFTQTGTYLVLYEGDKLGVATWTWQNIDTGLLHYSWDYTNMSSQVLSGDVSISIQGNRCVMKEKSSSNNVDFLMTYTLVEE